MDGGRCVGEWPWTGALLRELEASELQAVPFTLIRSLIAFFRGCTDALFPDARAAHGLDNELH